MPHTPIKNRWIYVTERRSDGRWFVGDVQVTIEPGQKKRRGPWKLSEETAIGLDLANRYEHPVTYGAISSTITFTSRWDNSVRLHRCRICAGPFIAHYSMKLCSDTCARANQKTWRERDARRYAPRPPSKAAQRPVALAGAKCLVCGEPFKPARLSARFCSSRCRQKNHRQTSNHDIVVTATLKVR